jgi:hypothetical protein
VNRIPVQDLPVPRLELYWRPLTKDGAFGDGYGNNWVVEYNLVKTFFSKQEKTPLGATKISRHRHPVDADDDTIDTPIRDGCHIKYDSFELKLPAFARCEGFDWAVAIEPREYLPYPEEETTPLGEMANPLEVWGLVADISRLKVAYNGSSEPLELEVLEKAHSLLRDLCRAIESQWASKGRVDPDLHIAYVAAKRYVDPDFEKRELDKESLMRNKIREAFSHSSVGWDKDLEDELLVIMAKNADTSGT